jgi:prepilin-type N-terminal cleavage/methylation domain-containing protein
MRQGFTLIELLLVVAVAGLLLGIALPSLSAALDHIEVGSAANHLVAAHQRARMMAVTRGQVLVLSIEAARLVIRSRGQASPLWSEDGPAAARVVLEGPAHQFTFSPVGLTLGLSNATVRLTRGAASRTIVISRLGRVRIVR